MQMLGLSEVINGLAMAQSVYWHGRGVEGNGAGGGEHVMTVGLNMDEAGGG